MKKEKSIFIFIIMPFVWLAMLIINLFLSIRDLFSQSKRRQQSDDPYLKIEKVWTTKSGFSAVVMMNDLFKIRTGFVGVPPGHFLFQKSCRDHIPEFIPYVDEILKMPLGKRSQQILHDYNPQAISMVMVFDVIHGISFTCGGHSSTYPIHSDNWWISFKCVQSNYHVAANNDQKIMSMVIQPTGDLQYCIDECESLGEQIQIAQWRFLEISKKIENEIDEMTR